MIKIFSHILLLSLLILSTAGLTINMHYCHNKLADVALNSPANTCCDDGDQDACPYCNDKSIEIESTDDFIFTATSFDFNNDYSFDLFLTNQSLTEDLRIAETATIEKPPLIKEVDLSQIQLFLI